MMPRMTVETPRFSCHAETTVEITNEKPETLHRASPGGECQCTAVEGWKVTAV